MFTFPVAHFSSSGGGDFDFSSYSGYEFDFNPISDNVTKNVSDEVSQVSDISGNANHATQSTGVNKPKWVDSIVNSLPVIRFDGANDYLECANTSRFKTDRMTFYMVAKLLTGGGSWKCVFGNGNNGGRWMVGPTSDSTDIAFQCNAVGGNRSSSTNATSDFHLFTWRYDESTLSVWENDSNTENVSDADGFSSGTDTLKVVVGARDTGTINSWAKVEIARMILYTTDHTNAEVGEINDELMSIYGL